MEHDNIFRIILILGFAAVFPVGVYHRLKSQASREKLDRRAEGLFILMTLRPIALIGMVGLLAYVINPAWMSWASFDLPIEVRWLGVGLGVIAGALLIVVLRTLGTNLTDTVVTRAKHTLITRGPYRWVRHPCYVAFALAVAAEIQIKLTPQEQARLVSAPLVNPEAYEAYLKGRFYEYRLSPRALDYFNLALEKDPDYALPYAGIADVWLSRGVFGLVPPREASRKVKAAALKAVELDDTLAEGHEMLGRFRFFYEWDWAGAEREFQRAIALNPNNPYVRFGYSLLLSSTKRPAEGLAQTERALELDPLNSFFQQFLGWQLLHMRRYDEAIAQLQKSVETESNFPPTHQTLWRAYHQKGMTEEALAEAKRFFALLGNREAPAALERGYAESGYRGAMSLGAEKLVAQAKLRYVQPTQIARLYAHAEKKDQALSWLERAYEERDPFLVMLNVDLDWNIFRDDPRFNYLLRRVGFEPDRKPESLPEPPSKIMLAVLPFKNLGSPDDEYFADGISDEIRSRLAAVRKLGVISRSSAFQYKDTDKNNRQIGSELGVDYLIDGTIRWDKHAGGAGRVRITPELIRIADDISLWSQPYNRVIEDIFEVQSDIAGQVIKQLKITLLEQERRVLEAKPTENTDAYHAYLRGLDYAGQPGYAEEKYRLAIQMFERAVKLDPSFAFAYAELSMVHSSMQLQGYDRTEARSARAKAAADRALELQPELPEAHLALGKYHYFCHREYDRALEALAIAEKDLPNDARILSIVGAIRRRQGRLEEALDKRKRAFELSPLHANFAKGIADAYFLLRRYSDAVRWCDRSISLAPNQIAAYQTKAAIHWSWHGDTDMARATLDEMPRKSIPDSIKVWFYQELLEREYRGALNRLASTSIDPIVEQSAFIPKSRLVGLVYQLMGESQRSREAYDAARIMLEKEVRKRPDDHRVRSSLGHVYAGLGRKKDAIREGKLGIELLPVSKDAVLGPIRIKDLALIYTMVGEHDAALDQIEYLLSIPSSMSVPMLRLDPRWDPLRNHPRYKDLLSRSDFEP